jgi:Protein of unknown function/Domain of unknown function (DUF1835)
MLHITFTESGAGFLRRALRQIGVRQPVVAFPDDLSFGPIDPPDPVERSAWTAANLRQPGDRLSPRQKLPPMPPVLGGWPSLAEATKEFWSLALAAEASTVWLTRRVPAEYCGFLAWAERAGTKKYNVVDVTDAMSSGERRLIFSIAHVGPSDLDYEGMLASAAPLEPQVREAHLRLWKTLRSENAALRVLVNAELVSAPISFFDDLLLSCVHKDWQLATRLAGEASAATWGEHSRQGDMEIMMARLFALVEARRVEFKGDLGEWRRSVEIRLPANLPIDGSRA